mmetsp:Transcript_50342/g.56257  ORF Transcript_50342/g.56257 Transcript_50342/m.56257 type:complete len:86 (-) Transcript_50342:27-284(-)
MDSRSNNNIIYNHGSKESSRPPFSILSPSHSFSSLFSCLSSLSRVSHLSLFFSFAIGPTTTTTNIYSIIKTRLIRNNNNNDQENT